MAHSVGFIRSFFGKTCRLTKAYDTVMQTVQSYVKSLNFSYRAGLRSAGVQYINALGRVDGPNTVSYVQKEEVGRYIASVFCLSVYQRLFFDVLLDEARNSGAYFDCCWWTAVRSF